LQVRGIADSIAEVGEVLAWLGAAFRLNPRGQDGLASCTPFVRKISKERASPWGDWNYSCRIDFLMANEAGQQSSPGRCWHGMFGDAVVVKGFPIPRRLQSQTGLEIPLSMAAALTASPRLHEFMGCFYLKGFSTMLVPVDIADGVVFWHFYYNAAGKRISYWDATRYLDKGISAEILRTARHVVGWCSEALCMAGKTAPQNSAVL
jgi:hypothetical protein